MRHTPRRICRDSVSSRLKYAEKVYRCRRKRWDCRAAPSALLRDQLRLAHSLLCYSTYFSALLSISSDLGDFLVDTKKPDLHYLSRIFINTQFNNPISILAPLTSLKALPAYRTALCIPWQHWLKTASVWFIISVARNEWGFGFPAPSTFAISPPW